MNLQLTPLERVLQLHFRARRRSQGGHDRLIQQHRILVCGGRNYQDRTHVFATLDHAARAWAVQSQPNECLVIVQGGAQGADKLARQWAFERGVLCITEHADWDNEGRRAGVLRNIKMHNTYLPARVIAFPGGRGTQHMIAYAQSKGTPVIEVPRRAI